MPSDGEEQPMRHPSNEFSEPSRELAGDTTTVDMRDVLLGERTQIASAPESRPILFVESGRDRGREFVLVPGETTVGRGMDNEVILSDLSVSRRHMEILREGDALTLRDSGSGNGTVVNGRRVEKHLLRNGDRIEIGETVLVLRGLSSTAIEMPLAESEPTIPPREEISFPPNDVSRATWEPPARTQINPVVIDRRTLVLAGLGIALVASLMGALVFAFMIEPTPPQPGPVSWVPTPSVTPSSTAPEVQPLTTEEPSVAPPTEESQGAQPSESPAVPVETRESPNELEAPDDVEHSRRSRTRELRRTPRPVREETPARTGPDRALQAYESGDFAGASRAAREAGQAARALQIDQFAIHYRNAQTAPVGSNVSISALERAIAIDNQIVRGGRYGARLRSQLVLSYLEVARDTIASRPEDACRRVQQALRLEASHERGLGLARQCESRAERLMDEARALERSEPTRARTLYQAILPMVRSSSPLYAEARRRSEAISRAQAVDEDQ